MIRVTHICTQTYKTTKLHIQIYKLSCLDFWIRLPCIVSVHKSFSLSPSRFRSSCLFSNGFLIPSFSSLSSFSCSFWNVFIFSFISMYSTSVNAWFNMTQLSFINLQLFELNLLIAWNNFYRWYRHTNVIYDSVYSTSRMNVRTYKCLIYVFLCGLFFNRILCIHIYVVIIFFHVWRLYSCALFVSLNKKMFLGVFLWIYNCKIINNCGLPVCHIHLSWKQLN